MNTLNSIIIASIFVSAIAASGTLLLLKNRLLDEKITYFVSFAAGILLAISFFDLLPHAAEGGATQGIFMAAFFGIITFFFLERFVLWFHHHDDLHGAKPSSLLIFLGDGLHNFIDGVAIAAAYLTNPALGFTTTLAIAAHEVPQEIADFSILIAGGMKKVKALLFNLLSGVFALAGAVSGFFFLENLRGILPMSLAFTAGMFIYIACSDLIPDLHHDFRKRKSWMQTAPFLAGIILTWLFVRYLEG